MPDLAIRFDVVAIGVMTGLGYALLASGLVLVYRATRVINLAHGQIGTFAAFLFVLLSHNAGHQPDDRRHPFGADAGQLPRRPVVGDGSDGEARARAVEEEGEAHQHDRTEQQEREVLAVQDQVADLGVPLDGEGVAGADHVGQEGLDHQQHLDDADGGDQDGEA